jgi:DNA-3-methyladenine glycosylase II
MVEAIDAVSDAEILACGLSNAKLRSIRDLASRVRLGTLALGSFDAMADEDIRSALVAVRGIGRWTADMFLIFTMCRPDVLATTDLGIQNAVGRLERLGRKATPAEVERAAMVGGWHPFASAACLHLWRSLTTKTEMVNSSDIYP